MQFNQHDGKTIQGKIDINGAKWNDAKQGVWLDIQGNALAQDNAIQNNGTATSAGDLTLPFSFTNSGTLTPGGQFAGSTLTFTGGFSQTAGGTLRLNAGPGGDRMVTDGPLALGGKLILDAPMLFQPTLGQVLTILECTGADPTTGYFLDANGQPIYEGGAVTVGSWTFRISYAGGSGGNDVTLTVGGITGRVWHDQDRDGIQDGGEFSASNFLVKLLDAQGNVVQSVWTDANGEYRFVGVAPGQYRIKVEVMLYVFSPQDQGSDDAIDSDVDATGTTALFALDAGEIEDWDAGIAPGMP